MPSRLEGVLLMTLYLIIAISAWYVAVLAVREIALLRAAQVLPSGSWVIDLHVYGYSGSIPAKLTRVSRKQTPYLKETSVTMWYTAERLCNTRIPLDTLPNYPLRAGHALCVRRIFPQS